MFVDASFIVSGTSDKLEIDVSPDYINFSKGNFIIKLVSLAMQMKVRTIRTETGDEIFIPVSSEDDLGVDSIVVITCNGCTGFYSQANQSEPLACEIPLAQVRLHKSKEGENIFININSDWHPIKHFDTGRLKFSLKESIYDTHPLEVPNEISLHFVVRRLRE